MIISFMTSTLMIINVNDYFIYDITLMIISFMIYYINDYFIYDININDYIIYDIVVSDWIMNFCDFVPFVTHICKLLFSMNIPPFISMHKSILLFNPKV